MRNLRQHTQTPTHPQIPVIVINRWCVILALLYVCFHSVSALLTCLSPNGTYFNLFQTIILRICLKLSSCSWVSTIKPVAADSMHSKDRSSLLPTSGQTAHYIRWRPYCISSVKSPLPSQEQCLYSGSRPAIALAASIIQKSTYLTLGNLFNTCTSNVTIMQEEK